VAVRLGGGGCERRGVLGGAGHLHPEDVPGALADQAGAVEHLAELGPQIRVGGAEHQRRRAGDCLARVGGASEAGDRAGPHPLADVLAGQLALGGHQPLAEHQDRRPLADPVGDRADRLRQRCRRYGEADQVKAGKLDLRGALHLHRLGQPHR
jgi:hypothetical protein